MFRGCVRGVLVMFHWCVTDDVMEVSEELLHYILRTFWKTRRNYKFPTTCLILLVCLRNGRTDQYSLLEISLIDFPEHLFFQNCIVYNTMHPRQQMLAGELCVFESTPGYMKQLMMWATDFNSASSAKGQRGSRAQIVRYWNAKVGFVSARTSKPTTTKATTAFQRAERMRFQSKPNERTAHSDGG